jgi:putative protein-disulfide isomerase
MSKAVLHYIYDPLCGWCYGSSPLVQAAREVQGLSLVLHGGGMMAGSGRQQGSEQLRGFVVQHARRIVALTGQSFTEAYTDGLVRDPTFVFDSEPPTTAILAVHAAAGCGPDMLARIFEAEYVEGRRITEWAVLAELAADLGVTRKVFDEHFARLSGVVVQAHIAESRRLLARVGGHGFPTFALESEGALEMLDHSRWLGDPQGWQRALEARLQTAR